MAQVLKKLSALAVKKKKKPGRYSDGGRLWLQITPTGSKSWLFQYSIHGKRNRQMGLGPVVGTSQKDIALSLKAAREKADECRALIEQGIDPLEDRRTKDAAQHEAKEAEKAVEVAKASKLTFGQCAAKYIESKKHGWTNPAHIAQWHSTFNETKRGKLTFPALTEDLNAVPVDMVDTAAVVECLEKIWTTKIETARRVRSRIEAVLDWAKARGARSGDNPARWSGHLKHILAKRPKDKKPKHHRAMPYSEVQRFTERLRPVQWVSHRALEFLILTATRTGAVINATWDEIDFAERLWTVQPERLGSKITDDKEKKVPLSDRAIEILKAVPREEDNPHIFVGGKKGRGLTEMAMLEVMRDMLPDPEDEAKSMYVPHGFRSAFKDWCTNETNYPNRVSEAALWHSIKDKTEAAYSRSDVLEKRKLLMAEWANYCSKPPIEPGDVVPMRRAKETA